VHFMPHGLVDERHDGRKHERRVRLLWRRHRGEHHWPTVLHGMQRGPIRGNLGAVELRYVRRRDVGIAPLRVRWWAGCGRRRYGGEKGPLPSRPHPLSDSSMRGVPS